MWARLLFDESLAELADELLLLEDEDVSAADAEAPRRNARIARVDDAERAPVCRFQPIDKILDYITLETKKHIRLVRRHSYPSCV